MSLYNFMAFMKGFSILFCKSVWLLWTPMATKIMTVKEIAMMTPKTVIIQRLFLMAPQHPRKETMMTTMEMKIMRPAAVENREREALRPPQSEPSPHTSEAFSMMWKNPGLSWRIQMEQENTATANTFTVHKVKYHVFQVRLFDFIHR